MLSENLIKLTHAIYVDKQGKQYSCDAHSEVHVLLWLGMSKFLDRRVFNLITSNLERSNESHSVDSIVFLLVEDTF